MELISDAGSRIGYRLQLPGPETHMDLALPVGLLLAFSALCYALLGWLLMRGPREPGYLALGMTAFAIAALVMGGALQFAATEAALYALGRIGYFLGTAFGPVTMLVAFFSYTGSTPPARAVGALLVIPALSLLLAVTNAHHQLMWTGPAVDASGAFLARPESWGAWFLFVHAPYSYTVAGAAFLKLILHSANVAVKYRRGMLALSAALAVPIVAILAFDVGLGPATLPYVPVVLAAMLPVFAWLIVGERVIEFSPIGLETVFQNMADPVVVLDDRGRVVNLNSGAEALLNVRESGAFRQSLENLFGDDLPEVYEAMSTGEPRRLITSTGRFLHVQASPIRSGNGGATGRVLMFRDVSDVENAQAEVRTSEKLLRTLFDHSVNGLIRMRWLKDHASPNPVLRCVSANAAATRFLKVAPGDVIDRSADEFLDAATAGMPAEDAAVIRQRFHEAINAGRVIDTEVFPADHRAGRWLRLIGEPVGDNVAVTLIDVTDNKAREEEMESIASTDPLTAVLNRRGFEHQANAQLSAVPAGATGALLFIDLNQFKSVNDRCGHEAGDQLLRIAADRLRTSLRSCDIVGRVGGDEFVALVPDVPARVAEMLAERLIEALEDPYRVAGQTVYCSASIGLAVYPDHGDSLNALLRAADAAMYRAKSRSYEVLDEACARNFLEKAG